MAVQENADYGKVPCFIHVCRGENLSRDLSVPKPKGDEEDEISNKVEREQQKSTGSKRRGFNKESESDNNRVEELLHHKDE